MDEAVGSWIAYRLPVVLAGFTLTAAATGVLLAATLRWARKALGFF